MNSNLVINYPSPQKASFEESDSASPAANSASPERSAKRYEAALEKFGHLVPELKEHSLCDRAHAAELALKHEEDFSSYMYLNMRNAYYEVRKAAGLGVSEADTLEAIENAEDILRNILRLYLEVHSN